MPKRANGEGSIYRASDGRWVGALTLNGKRKVFYGKTRQEANAKMTAALASVHRGLPLVPERETVKSYLERWLADMVKPGVRPSTYDSYEAITRVHLIPSLGKIPLAKLTPQHVQAMLNENSPEHVRRHLSSSAPRSNCDQNTALRPPLSAVIHPGCYRRCYQTAVPTSVGPSLPDDL